MTKNHPLAILTFFSLLLTTLGAGCSSPQNKDYTGQAGPVNESAARNQDGGGADSQGSQNPQGAQDQKNQQNQQGPQSQQNEPDTSTEQASNADLPPPASSGAVPNASSARPADNLGARSSGRGR